MKRIQIFLRGVGLSVVVMLCYQRFVNGEVKFTAPGNNWRDGYTLVILSNADIKETNKARDIIENHGGRIAILYSPHVMLGWIAPESDQLLIGKSGIVSIHHEVLDPLAVELNEAGDIAAVRFFNYVVGGESKTEELSSSRLRQTAKHLSNCVQGRPGANQKDVEENLKRLGIASSSGGISDSMCGTVAVALFFIESNGIIDQNKYTWSSDDESQTLNRALSGLSWWSSKAPNYGESVTFSIVTYSSTNPVCQQSYEPILHPSTDDHLWISSIMNNLGYTGDYISAVTSYDNWLRSNKSTDWAFSVFIGYNPPPSAPDTFTNGYFAYVPDLGGPYTQMLFNNDGWGIENFGSVLTHETGHIFWACDEYYEAGYGGCTSCGPCGVAPNRIIENGNCEYCNDNSVPCMMRANSNALCDYTPPQIGWCHLWKFSGLQELLVLTLVSEGSKVFAGTYGDGVYRSADYGASWLPMNSGMKDTVIVDLALHNGYLFAGTPHGIYRSPAQGNTWTEVDSGLWRGDLRTKAIVVSGSSLAATVGSHVFFSSNNGDIWKHYDTLGNYFGAQMLADNGSYLFGASYSSFDGIYRTSDRGAHWTAVNSGFQDSTVVEALEARGSYLFAATYHVAGSTAIPELYRSNNSGDNWIRVDSGSLIKSFAFSDSKIFFGGYGGIKYSTDNGMVWKPFTIGVPFWLASALTVSGSYLCAGGSCIFGPYPFSVVTGIWRRDLRIIPTSVDMTTERFPTNLNLEQNYPNPFNPSTTINYQLPTQSHVTLKVFDVLGREVVTLVNGVEGPGYKSVMFDASKMSSGVYYYRLQAGNYVETKKFVLIK